MLNEMLPEEMSTENCAGKIKNICAEARHSHGWITLGKSDIDTLDYVATVIHKLAVGKIVELPTENDTCNNHAGEKIDVIKMLQALQWKLDHEDDFSIEDISEIELWCLNHAIETERRYKAGELVKLPDWPITLGQNIGRYKIVGANSERKTITLKEQQK